MTPKALREYESAIKALESQLSKGIVKQIMFGNLANGHTLMQEKYARGILASEDLNISLIIKGRQFDTPPYIYFKK